MCSFCPKYPTTEHANPLKLAVPLIRGAHEYVFATWRSEVASRQRAWGRPTSAHLPVSCGSGRRSALIVEQIAPFAVGSLVTDGLDFWGSVRSSRNSR